MINKLCFVLLAFCLSAATLFGNNLETMRSHLETYPTIHYPYDDLPEKLAAENAKSILIFSYGSLMDVNSASRTLGKQSMNSRRPALAYDLRRTFDRKAPVAPNSVWGQPINPEAVGMLNVHRSDLPGEFVNGVLIDVTIADVPEVLSREVGYDLIPVIVQNWSDAATGKQNSYQIAYTFHAPIGTQYTDSTILPRPKYYETARDAAAQYGDLFLSLWFKSTYFADGETPISIWEEFVQMGDTNTQVK